MKDDPATLLLYALPTEQDAAMRDWMLNLLLESSSGDSRRHRTASGLEIVVLRGRRFIYSRGYLMVHPKEWVADMKKAEMEYPR